MRTAAAATASISRASTRELLANPQPPWLMTRTPNPWVERAVTASTTPFLTVTDWTSVSR